MLPDPVLRRFVDQNPITVMAGAARRLPLDRPKPIIKVPRNPTVAVR
jgi:hypothetical protein